MDLNINDLSGDNDVRRSAEAHLVSKAQKDASFRQELIRNPRGVIAKELGIQLSNDFEVKVIEESAKSLYIVIPATAEGELSDLLLEAVAGGKASPPPTTAPKAPYKTTDPNTGEMDRD